MTCKPATQAKGGTGGRSGGGGEQRSGAGTLAGGPSHPALLPTPLKLARPAGPREVLGSLSTVPASLAALTPTCLVDTESLECHRRH